MQRGCYCALALVSFQQHCRCAFARWGLRQCCHCVCIRGTGDMLKFWRLVSKASAAGSVGVEARRALTHTHTQGLQSACVGAPGHSGNHRSNVGALSRACVSLGVVGALSRAGDYYTRDVGAPVCACASSNVPHPWRWCAVDSPLPQRTLTPPRALLFTACDQSDVGEIYFHFTLVCVPQPFGFLSARARHDSRREGPTF